MGQCYICKEYKEKIVKHHVIPDAVRWRDDHFTTTIRICRKCHGEIHSLYLRAAYCWVSQKEENFFEEKIKDLMWIKRKRKNEVV